MFYFAPIRLGRPDAGNRHTLALCNHLAARGHEIWLFAPAGFSHLPDLHPRVHVVPVPVLHGAGRFFTTLSFYLLLPWRSWSLFRSQQPNIVYTRASYLDWLAITPLQACFSFLYAAEVNGIRSLETQGGRVRRELIASQERVSLRLADKVITVTPELGQWAKGQGHVASQDIAVIGNGVDTDLFRPMPASEARARLGLEQDSRYLTFVGSLKPWHDTNTMLRALAAVKDAFAKEVHLLVVGAGPGRTSIPKLARHLGVSEEAQLVGQVRGDQVPLYIAASDVCLAPFTTKRNQSTGKSPIKIYEYMSCGRPFVATCAGTHFDQEIADCRCGLLVPPDDPARFAGAVIELLQNPDRRQRLGRRARQQAVDRYSWATIARQTEEFLTR